MTRDQERAIEWECEKVFRQYYHHVDQREFEKAVQYFAPDVQWNSMGVTLYGREEILKSLYPALGNDTIRHIITNMVVHVIDEDHAESRSYSTIYYAPNVKFEERQGPIHFEGPHRIHDQIAEFVRMEDGWKIARRRSFMVFRRDPDNPVALEAWAKKEGKLGPLDQR